MEPAVVLVFSLAFWLVLRKARSAIAENLLTILPGSSLHANHFRVLRVFWNFAWTLADHAHVRHGEDIITWELDGLENLEHLDAQTGGCIILTAHMGSYDVAAPMFAKNFTKPIHMVRTPERDEESQRFQTELRAKENLGAYVVHFNEPGNMIGVELARALDEGAVVAIQGDRILFDVTSLETRFSEGVVWNVPRGPFVLAWVSRAPIYPVVTIRVGYRRYRVKAGPPLHLDRASGDKEKAQKDAAAQWNEVLKPQIQKHWYQWFVFEPMFRPTAKP